MQTLPVNISDWMQFIVVNIQTKNLNMSCFVVMAAFEIREKDLILPGPTKNQVQLSGFRELVSMRAFILFI